MTDPGRLVLVATPIGNLGDLSPRARQTLADADVICCEDTRRTRALLTHAGITGAKMLSVHGHNENARVADVVARIAAGSTVALVSDAGTPAVSDPGRRMVAAVAGAGLEVTVVPGPNAATAALVVSGFDTDRFCFEGFLPRTGSDRRRRLEALRSERRTALIHEAPGRVAATMGHLAEACGADRRVAVSRELTKLHEETWRGTLAEALEEFPPQRDMRGEFVIVLEGAPEPQVSDDDEVSSALVSLLQGGATLRDAAAEVAGRLGVARRRVYEIGLSMKRNAGA